MLILISDREEIVMAEHQNKHIREAIRYAKGKGWIVAKQMHEHIFGALYGVP